MAVVAAVPKLEDLRCSTPSLVPLAAIEREHQARGQRVLVLYRVAALQERRLIRHVPAELEAADDVVRNEFFVGGGELVEVDSRGRPAVIEAGREAVVVVVVFVAGAECRGAGEGVLDVTGNAGPVHRFRERTFAKANPDAASVVAIDDERQLAGR